jgi:hypothetical protein
MTVCRDVQRAGLERASWLFHGASEAQAMRVADRSAPIQPENQGRNQQINELSYSKVILEKKAGFSGGPVRNVG